jgi:hypothetical protein
MVGAQGCFYSSSGPNQYGQQYGSSRTVCNANGQNCMVCDADNPNCQRVGSQYGSSQRRSCGILVVSPELTLETESVDPVCWRRSGARGHTSTEISDSRGVAGSYRDRITRGIDR